MPSMALVCKRNAESEAWVDILFTALSCAMSNPGITAFASPGIGCRIDNAVVCPQLLPELGALHVGSGGRDGYHRRYKCTLTTQDGVRAAEISCVGKQKASLKLDWIVQLVPNGKS